MTGLGALLATCHVATAEDRPGAPSSLWDVVRGAFVHLDEPAAVALGKQIAAELFASGQRTGNLKPWAEAQHRLPRPGQREAAQELCRTLDAWRTPPPARPADDSGRRLRRLACQLVRAGTTGRELLRRLDEADATLPAPLSAEAVGRIAAWAAHTARKGAHDAR